MKKLVLVIMIPAIMLLTGCGRYSAWHTIKAAGELAGLFEETEYEETDIVKEELGSLSDDEKRILSRGGYYAKDRIYAGHLYESEVNKVKNIRGAKEYLAENYPDHEFRITLYASRGKKSTSPTGDIGDDLIWVDIDGEDTQTWVQVKETENGLEFSDCIKEYLDRKK